VSLDKTAFEKTEEDHPELLPGGHWAPTSCVPRQRIAIIVPFRDRESHLKVFLRILHPFLQRQLLDYTIFVVEQVLPEPILLLYDYLNKCDYNNYAYSCHFLLRDSHL